MQSLADHWTFHGDHRCKTLDQLLSARPDDLRGTALELLVRRQGEPLSGSAELLGPAASLFALTLTVRLLRERSWEPPVPIGAAGEVPAFPVEVLPGWLGEYVAAVATATQTPPDLAAMLALAVLATVAAGAVEVEPRPGWREPLCLFVAVGMDAGSRKSGVFTAMTRPVAEFETLRWFVLPRECLPG